MKCVKTCEFIGVVKDGHTCKFHRVPIIEDQHGALLRCRQCERHAYYNKLVKELDGVLDEYNSFVSAMDDKFDTIHFLMERTKDKI